MGCTASDWLLFEDSPKETRDHRWGRGPFCSGVSCTSTAYGGHEFRSRSPPVPSPRPTLLYSLTFADSWEVHGFTFSRTGPETVTCPEDFTKALRWSSAFSVFFFVIIVSGYKICRRNLRLGLEVSGFALMIFDFVAFGLVTLARAGHIARISSELNAPRYLSWSALFWTGLLLVLLGLSENRPRLSWAAIWTVMSLPAPGLPLAS